jgi:hypothetical protein
MKSKNTLKIKLANLRLEYENLVLDAKKLMNSSYDGRIDAVVNDLNAVTDKIERISKQIKRLTNKISSGEESSNEPTPNEVSETSLLELYKEYKKQKELKNQ